MASHETPAPTSPFARASHPRPHRGSVRLGKLQLALIFLILRALDAWFFFRVLPHTSPELRAQGVASVVGFGFFTTALIICVGFRQAWARYLLIAVLLLNVILAMTLWPVFRTVSEILLMAAPCLVYLLLALWCIRSRSIQRLVSRRFE